MPAHRRRIHRSRRSKKPLIIGGFIAAIAAIAIIAFYVTSTSEHSLTIYTVGQGSVLPTNGTYAPGTSVNLEAVSASGWTFYGWSGDASGANDTIITMDSNKAVTATFIPNKNKVLLTTSRGEITIQLRDDMPITAGNFKNLVQQGKLDGTIFHRVVAGFMIQGGQINSSWSSIQDEFGSNNHNTRGTIAMAKTNQPNSATSQFFINVVDNSNRYATFDTTYSVFGDVISGMDVVDAIAQVPVVTDPLSGEHSKPAQDVILIKAQLID
ncbi:MAG: peptidylprolyl isomerase [Candidatus Bathyarchaeota archaeon]|nr:peptidylprolyl isomerase [Candidatus Bathyarchaeota archaeon]